MSDVNMKIVPKKGDTLPLAVAHVNLLRLIPLGPLPDQKKLFVETKNTMVIENRGIGVFYYSGFLNTIKEANGWRIAGGTLEPENMAWEFGGHQPWQADPLASIFTRQFFRGEGIIPSVRSPVVAPFSCRYR